MMDERLRKTVAEVLSIPIEEVGPETSPGTQPRWDSLRHMNLVFAIEEAFSVQFDDEEIPALTSVAAIEEALARRL